ncbi:MAG TPA: NAD(P)-binding domain-containing protein [Flavisolibacter sp.]|nr:NAD(P)-binding domain-containing protein [Flavisolibacter sp.]
MNIGVLGTGVVGETIATALTEKGHNVRMGSRSANNEKAAEWVKKSNNHATQGDFNDAASFGEIVFLCLNGAHALDAVGSVDVDNVAGKIVIDVTNPLDFSKGMPPRLLDGLSNSNSLGEEIQKAWPAAKVVKVFNTVNCNVMVNPKLVNNGDHSLFICGDDADAKNKVKHFLVDTFGWKADNLLDLGGIQSARVTEAYVPLWVSMMQAVGTPMFSIQVVK